MGQHFLKSNTIAKSIVTAAKITKNDLVLEIGTGHGILIPFSRIVSSDLREIQIDQEKPDLSALDLQVQ